MSLDVPADCVVHTMRRFLRTERNLRTALDCSRWQRQRCPTRRQFQHVQSLSELFKDLMVETELARPASDASAARERRLRWFWTQYSMTT